MESWIADSLCSSLLRGETKRQRHGNVKDYISGEGDTIVLNEQTSKGQNTNY